MRDSNWGVGFLHIVRIVALCGNVSLRRQRNNELSLKH